MSKANKTQLILGILLVLAGVWFVVAQQIPALKFWVNLEFVWPFYVIGAGVLILLVGLLTGEPRMAIPASIVAGVGGILYYQNIHNNDYSTWSFLWTLIPGFVGIGNILAGLFGDDTLHSLGRGVNLVVISAILFLIFAAIFHQLTFLGTYGLAGLLILFGLYVIGRGLIGARKSASGG